MAEHLPEDEYLDEFGFAGPLAASEGQRTPPPEGFAFGPAIGTRLPGFKLRNALGDWVDLHADRGSSKAAVVFFRSAVW